MVTLALCDDEPYFLDVLQACVSRYLSTYDRAAEILVFSSGEALLQASHGYDIVLMDLNLPGKNGIAVVEALRAAQQNCQVIFITAHPDYALEAFGVDAVQYLLKPISEQALFHALDKAFQWMGQLDDKTLLIAKDSNVQRIFLRDILYCEAVNHKIYIHTAAAQYAYFGTLATLGDKLDARFFQCHRSYIVNLHYVLRKDRDTLTMAGGHQVLVSRRQQQALTQRLLHFFREEVL